MNKNSYWQDYVFNIVNLSHPYMSVLNGVQETAEFIANKGNLIAENMKERIANGMRREDAEQLAKEEALDGLKFSPTDWLSIFLYQEKNIELDIQERIELYVKTKAIFDEVLAKGEIEDVEIELEERILEFLN